MKLPQGKAILVVDDDVQLAETLASVLRSKGLIVKLAHDGISAQQLITLEDFDLVISDIRMPNLNGIELLHFVKRTKKIPVILMTGFSEISETKEAYEMGAVAFLPKPFKQSDLVDAISQVLKEDAKNEELESDQGIDLDSHFVGLRIEEFISGNEILFDIYIRITNTKYLKVAVGGESLDLDRVLKYKERGITHLYLKKDDFRKYIGFTSILAKRVADSSLIEAPRKLQFLTQTGTALLKDMYLREVDEDAYMAATELVVTTIQVAAEQGDAMVLFEALQQHGDYLYKHSLAVSVYSVLVAKSVGWNSPRTVMRLGLCGLLHDIGKKEIPLKILEKARIDLTAEEVQLIESHPRRGMELLERVQGIPEEVPVVALQHHENNRGMGHPLRLTKNKITPIARLVALVNLFCELVFKGAKHEGMSPADAIQSIRNGHAGMYDEEFINGICEVFHLPYEGRLKK